MMKNALAAVALASCITPSSWAASPSPVPANLLACSQLKDAGERVRCYDAQIAVMNRAAGAVSAPAPASSPSARSPVGASATPSSAAASAAASPARPPAARFGEELLPPRLRPKSSREEAALVSSITSVREVGPKIFLISLANGQVWRQDGSHIVMFFRAGDPVRIERHALGSYHMSTSALGSKNWVYVTRIR